jgi:hypothetical protein
LLRCTDTRTYVPVVCCCCWCCVLMLLMRCMPDAMLPLTRLCCSW